MHAVEQWGTGWWHRDETAAQGWRRGDRATGMKACGWGYIWRRQSGAWMVETWVPIAAGGSKPIGKRRRQSGGARMVRDSAQMVETCILVARKGSNPVEERRR